MSDAAHVMVHGRAVGLLQRINDWEDFVFEFDPAWLADPERPTLGQFFEDHRPSLITSSGLPCWFAHLLPQGLSKRLFLRWKKLAEDDPFEIVTAMGTDLMGATTLVPADAGLNPRRYAVGARPTLPETGGTFVLPGAQVKLSADRDGRGLVIPARGEAGSFIAKFHDPLYNDLPRLECAATRWASLAGLSTHQVELGRANAFENIPEGIPTGDGTVLLARRFDRDGAQRVHMEDFGQITGTTPDTQGQRQASHEQLGHLIHALCPDDLEEYLRRVVFFILCGNGDAHLKNWAVIYPDRRTPSLSPAFDIVPSVLRLPNDDFSLKLSGSTAFESFSTNSFEHFHRYDLPFSVEEVVVDMVAKTRDALHEHKADLDFTAEEVDALHAHMARVPLAS